MREATEHLTKQTAPRERKVEEAIAARTVKQLAPLEQAKEAAA